MKHPQLYPHFGANDFSQANTVWIITSKLCRTSPKGRDPASRLFRDLRGAAHDSRTGSAGRARLSRRYMAYVGVVKAFWGILAGIEISHSGFSPQRRSNDRTYSPSRFRELRASLRLEASHALASVPFRHLLIL